jgi:hypothetical protein
MVSSAFLLSLLLSSSGSGALDSLPVRCGTSWAHLGDGTKGRGPKRMEGRPVLSGSPETLASTDHKFLFHFTRSGVDAVTDRDLSPQNGVPDYVDDVIEGVRRAYEDWVTVGGWPDPPGDQGVGGDDRIDVYIKRITCQEAGGISSCPPGTEAPQGLFGVTWSENRVAGTSRLVYTSFIIINNANDIPLGRNWAQSVAAHEFHHVIQFGMDVHEPGWVYESTAAYLQLQLFRILQETPYLVDALLVPRLDRPDLGLETEEGRLEYSNGLWFRFLVDRFGDEDLVREVWERAARSDTPELYTAFDEVLAPHQSRFTEALTDWGEWNYFLCGRDDGRHYHQGAYCVSPSTSVRLQGTHQAYPVAETASPTPAEPLGFNYFEFRPDGSGKDLVVSLSGAGGLAVRLLLVSLDCTTSAVAVPIGTDGTATARVDDLHRYRTATLMVANPNRSGSATDLRYSARTERTYTGQPPPTSTALRSVSAEPTSVDLPAAGATANLIALAHFDDCSSLNVTLLPTTVWRSSDPSVAEVNGSGIVTALRPGRTLVVAAYGGQEATPVSVRVGPLQPTPPPPKSGGCSTAGWGFPAALGLFGILGILGLARRSRKRLG